MASVNKVIIVGNLGRDPEIRYTGSGQAVANFSVATSEKWTDKVSSRGQERTEWHRIVVWGKQAETCGRFLKKGRTVYVEGKLQTREYEDLNGNTRSITEIVASNIVFLGSGSSGEPLGKAAADDGRSGQMYADPVRDPVTASIEHEDVPF